MLQPRPNFIALSRRDFIGTMRMFPAFVNDTAVSSNEFYDSSAGTSDCFTNVFEANAVFTIERVGDSIDTWS